MKTKHLKKSVIVLAILSGFSQANAGAPSGGGGYGGPGDPIAPEVAAGTNVASVTSALGADGQTVYTVNANGTTVSAAASGALTVAGTPGANNVTDYAVDLSQTTKDDIKAGVDAKDAIDNTGLTFNGDTGSTGIKKLGDAVAVIGDTNITTEATAAGVAIKLNPNINLGAAGSVTVGNTVINNAGLTISGGPSVTSAGIDAANNKITKLTAGDVNSTSTDAVNGSQLYAVSEVANKGHNVTTAATGTGTVTGTAVTNVAPGDTVTYTAGNNIEVTQNGKEIQIATSLTPTFTTVNTTNLNTTGVTNLGGTTNITGDAYYTGPITNGDNIVNKTYVDQMAAAAKTEVAAGTNIASVTSAPGANGQTIYTVNANGTTASAGSTAVTVTPTAGANNVTDYAVDLSQTTKDSLTAADTALQTVVTQIDGTAVKTISKTDNTANFVTGNNIVLSDDGAGGIKVATADNVTFNTVNTTNLYSTGETKLGNNFTVNNAGDVTYIGPITSGDNIVNKAYVDQSTTNLINTGINITAQGGAPDNIKLGETIDYANTDGNIVVSNGVDNQVLFDLAPVVTVGTTNPVVIDGNTGVIGGLTNTTWNPTAIVSGQAATEDQLLQAAAAAKTTVTQGDNIVVTPTTNADGSITYQVATAKDVVFDSVTVGSVSLDSKNVDVTGNTIISGVGAGEVSSTSTDAINGSQLYALGTGVQNIIGGTTTYDPTTGTYVNNNIGGTGENNINDAIASVKDAATKAKTTVTQGDNIVVTQTTNADGSTNYEVATAKDVTFDSVTVGSVSLDSKNVDVTGNTIISGVGAGEVSSTSTDAINGSQLYALGTGVQNIIGGNTTYDPTTGTYVNNNIGNTGKNNINDAIASVNDAATKAKTTVTAGSNVVVTPTTNADGSSNYEVAVADDLNVNSVTANAVTVGSVSIDSTNVDASGNTIISGVGAGEISSTSTDAVNGSQLYATNQQVAQNTTNIAKNTTDITNINTTLDKGLNFSADSGSTVNRKLGDTVAITGDKNIVTTTTANGVQIKLSDNIDVNNVNVSQSITVAEGATVNMGGNVIQNVGAGVNGTDAVNVNQLYATNQAVDALGGRVNDLSRGLDSTRKEAFAGAAAAMAMQLPHTAPGKVSMGIGAGSYKGQTAGALSVKYTTKNNRFAVGGGVSYTGHGTGVNLAASWTFGSSEPAPMAQTGYDSSVYGSGYNQLNQTQNISQAPVAVDGYTPINQ